MPACTYTVMLCHTHTSSLFAKIAITDSVLRDSSCRPPKQPTVITYVNIAWQCLYPIWKGMTVHLCVCLGKALSFICMAVRAECVFSVCGAVCAVVTAGYFKSFHSGGIGEKQMQTQLLLWNKKVSLFTDNAAHIVFSSGKGKKGTQVKEWNYTYLMTKLFYPSL